MTELWGTADGSYTEDSVFVRLFGSPDKVKIIDVFLAKHYEELSAAQVADLAGVDVSTFHRNINQFLDIGVVQETKRVDGTQFYQLTTDHPVSKALGELQAQLLNHVESLEQTGNSETSLDSLQLQNRVVYGINTAREALEEHFREGVKPDVSNLDGTLNDYNDIIVSLHSTETGDALGGRRYGQNSPLSVASIPSLTVNVAQNELDRESNDPSDVKINVCLIKEVFEPDEPIEEFKSDAHGIEVEGRGRHAIMPPFLIKENDWSVFECFDRTCKKAGLPRGAWEDDDVTIRFLETVMATETEPNGSIDVSFP